MRTKILLLIAAAAAASIVSSNAQVYSVNAVGYVNKVVPKGGFALLANPLIAQTNTIPALLANMLKGGEQVFAWNTTSKSYDIGQFDSELGWTFSPASLATKEFKPGSGFFIQNPNSADLTITFVGEVAQGTGANKLSTPIVAGFQILGSQVPQAGNPVSLGYVPNDADQIYAWNNAAAPAGQKYTPYQFDASLGWTPSLPTNMLDVGDAFFLSSTKAGSWTREFSVNQ